MSRLFALSIAIALLTPGRLITQSDPQLALQAVRFYRPDTKQTRVTAFVEIPYQLVEPTGGPSSHLSYKLMVRVVDSAGTTLLADSWPNRAPKEVRQPGASAVQMVDFAVAPGTYLLEVAVEDSVSGRTATSAVEVEGFREPPAASDLMLSPRMRPRTPKDSAEPGEFPRGQTLVTAAARLVLTPLSPKAFYLLEAYCAKPDSGQLTVTLRDSQGKPVVETPGQPVVVAAGGGILKGQLDLSGLPPGEYSFKAVVLLGSHTIERSGRLVMAELQPTLEREVARRAADRISDAGYFAAMTPAELEQAKASLLYLADASDQMGIFDQLSTDAKRRWLTEFWRKRDPTPATPRNERREQYYTAIEYANRTFREGGRNPQAGWSSSRGRIHLLYGAPPDMLARQQEGPAPPYQVWRYTSGKPRYYIFADRSGFGGYNLIASNDLKETTLPGWQGVLGPIAVQDIERYLGISLLNEQ